MEGDKKPGKNPVLPTGIWTFAGNLIRWAPPEGTWKHRVTWVVLIN